MKTKKIMLMVLGMVLLTAVLCSLTVALQTPLPFEDAKRLAMTGTFTKGDPCHIWLLEIFPRPEERYYVAYCETHKAIQIIEERGPTAGALVYFEETGQTHIVAMYRGQIIEKREIEIDKAIEWTQQLLTKIKGYLENPSRPNPKALKALPVVYINSKTENDALDIAKSLAIKDGVTVQESGRDYKRWRKAGLGLGGWWYFYTIKYYQGAVVFIVYQPEKGAVFAIREDPDAFNPDRFIYSIYILRNHSEGVWSLYNIGRDTANGLIKQFLHFIDFLSNRFDFEPTEEMREDLCWKVEAE